MSALMYADRNGHKQVVRLLTPVPIKVSSTIFIENGMR